MGFEATTGWDPVTGLGVSRHWFLVGVVAAYSRNTRLSTFQTPNYAKMKDAVLALP